MREKNIDKAVRIGETLARHYYKDFTTHKEYMGSKWEWKKFPHFAFRHGEVECFLYFPRGVKKLRNLEFICAHAAKEEAKRLMKDGKWQQK